MKPLGRHLGDTGTIAGTIAGTMAVDAGVLMGQLVERMVEVQGAVEDFMAGLEALVGGEKVAAELEALVQQTVGAYNAVDKMDVDIKVSAQSLSSFVIAADFTVRLH